MNQYDLIKGGLWLLMIAYVLLRYSGPAWRSTTPRTSPDPAAATANVAPPLTHTTRAAYLGVLFFATLVFSFISIGGNVPFGTPRSILEIVALATTAALLVLQEAAIDERAASSGGSAPNAVRLIHIGVGALWLFVL